MILIYISNIICFNRIKITNTIILLFFCSLLSEANSQTNNEKPHDPDKNGNGSLGVIYDNFDCGLDYVQASRKVTSRNTGLGSTAGGAGSGFPCVLAISGIPSCYIIDKAYVWAMGSFGITLPAPGATAAMTFTNPSGVATSTPLSIVGSAGEKCWGESFSATYRADVTALITGNGNYTINATGLRAAETDGVTLMIIFKDITTGCTSKGRLIIKDGIISFNGTGTASSTITGINPCENVAAGNVKAFALSTDFQLLAGGHNFNVGGSSSIETNIFYDFDVKGVALTTGTASLAYSTSSAGGLDCFSLGIVGLYYRTSTAAICGGICPNPFTVIASNTGPYCAGATINLNRSVSPVPNCGSTFSWSGPSSFASTSPSPSIPSSTSSNGGTYNLTTTFPGTCLSPVLSPTIVSMNACLPVEFLEAHIECESFQNKLVWSTASEFKNDHFEIWSSSNGLDWDLNNLIPAKGQSSSIQVYQSELERTRETGYYKLTQVDQDGASVELKILNNADCNENKEVIIYPNPASSAVFIELNTNELATVRIRDAGNKILFELNDYHSQSPISVKEFSSGMYWIEIITKEKVFNQLFIK